jgi:hypothetical protein
MKPGYSVVGLYGRVNGVGGVFVSGNLAQRVARQFGSSYKFSTQAIIATGVEVDQLFDSFTYKKDYPGRSLFVAQAKFTADFQDLLFEQIEQGLVKEIFSEIQISDKTAGVLRALSFAKNSAIVFIAQDFREFDSDGKRKIRELFSHRSGFLIF